jgi:predicted component of viral defense system (DUF524 family)
VKNSSQDEIKSSNFRLFKVTTKFQWIAKESGVAELSDDIIFALWVLSSNRHRLLAVTDQQKDSNNFDTVAKRQLINVQKNY